MTKRSEMLLFAGLILFGVAARLALQGLPNVAPVAAIALFSAYAFRSRWVALAAPLCVMIASDWLIQSYDWRMMLVVYAALAWPVCLRGPLRRWIQVKDAGSAATASLGLGICTLGSSLLFFVATNLAVWLWHGTYEASLAGLLQCYYAALPFFRYTLIGDAGFVVCLFGSYAAVTSIARMRQPAADIEPLTSESV